MGRAKGSKNKETKRGMSKDGVSSMVFASNQQKYIDEGGHFGHDTDKQKELKKKGYNNGVEEATFSINDIIPEGGQPGMLPVEKGRYAKFEYKWYTNGTEQKRLSLLKGDTIPEGGGEGQSDSMAAKSRTAALGSVRTPEQIQHHKEGAAKAGIKKLARGTFNASQPEEELYKELCEKYGEDNVLRQYNEDLRYPWHCDFYIPSEDLFIEVNKFPTHGPGPFDANNPEHIALLEHCKTEPDNWVQAKMVDVGANYDVKKRETAHKNNLNFIEIY